MLPWYLVALEDNPEIACVKWQSMFLSVIDNQAPHKQKRVRNVISPWITPDSKKLMFQRRERKKIASRFPTEAN